MVDRNTFSVDTTSHGGFTRVTAMTIDTAGAGGAVTVGDTLTRLAALTGRRISYQTLRAHALETSRSVPAPATNNVRIKLLETFKIVSNLEDDLN